MNKLILTFGLFVLMGSSQALAQMADSRLFPPRGTCPEGQQAIIGWENNTGLTCLDISQSDENGVISVGQSVVVTKKSIGQFYGLQVKEGVTYPEGGFTLPKKPSNVDGAMWIDLSVAP